MDSQNLDMFQEVDMFVMLLPEWAKRVGVSEVEMILDIFSFALGQKPGDDSAKFSSEDLRNRLYYLVDDSGTEEGFLVTAVIKCIDNWLEIISEDYSKTIHRSRGLIEAFRSDPLNQAKQENSAWLLLQDWSPPPFLP